jgi:hypothetical protein
VDQPGREALKTGAVLTRRTRVNLVVTTILLAGLLCLLIAGGQ